MNEFNLYKDIKDSINENAFLIEAYGFETFEEEQLAYEYHFTAKNDKGDIIDISFEAIASSPIWVKINNSHLENIFKDAPLEGLESELKRLYKDNFDKYLELNDESYLEHNFENYKTAGKELNHKKLNRIFEILKDNLESLLIKSNELSSYNEEPVPYSKTISELQELSKTEVFNNSFVEYQKMTIDTDKCEIEIHSIEELNDVLKLLSEQNITSIDWRFEK